MAERNVYYSSKEFQAPTIGGRPAMEAINEIISVFECTAPEDGSIYLSSEITTGKRFYDLLRRHGVRSKEELKQKLGSDFSRTWQKLLSENLAEGYAFFKDVHGQGSRDLVNPGPFFARGWEQEHYLYLWEWVIVHKCHETRFNSGWSYSNGCTLEYAISLHKRIPRRHPDGRPLEAADAIAQVEATLTDLDASGIDATVLRRNLERIREG